MSGAYGASEEVDQPRSAMLRLGETTIVDWVPGISPVDRRPLLDDAHVHLHLVIGGVFTRRDGIPGENVSWAIHEGEAFFTRGVTALGEHSRRPCRLVTVSVPREVFPAQALALAEPFSRVRNDSGLLPPVRAFVVHTRETATAELSGVARYYLERLLQEMVVAVAVDIDRHRGVPRARDVYAQALSVIAAQCTDAGLSAASIARDVSLSLRQLERVFRERGTTIATETRRARIEHAVSLLRQREYDALNIDQVGAYSGFSNGSTLARAMRAAGWPSPARVRADSRAQR